MPISEIKQKSPVWEVQEAMNRCVGEIRWGTISNVRWRNTLKARNNFFKQALAEMKLSIREYRSLDQEIRRNCALQLQAAFERDFFQFTRDANWMALAIGDEKDWIAIPGMSQWMHFHAMSAIDKEPPAALAPSSQEDAGTLVQKLVSQPVVPTPEKGEVRPRPFDPVKDSMLEVMK